MLRMIKSKHLFWFVLALLVCVSFVMAGCSSDETSPALPAPPTTTVSPTPSPTPTIPSAQEISDNALKAMAGLTSVQMAMDIQATMSGTIEDMPQPMKVSAKGTGASDIAAHNMQLALAVEMETANESKVSMPVEMYMVDGWMYSQITMPFSPPQWSKMKAPQEAYSNNDQAAKAMELFKSAVKVVLSGTEKVDGVNCYVLEITPDLAAIPGLMQQFIQDSGMQSEEMDKFDLTKIDLTKFVKDLTIREYIATDSYLLKKCSGTASIYLNEQDMNDLEKESTGESADVSEIEGVPEEINLDMTFEMSLSGHNQPVTITLPPEAANATENDMPLPMGGE